MIFYITVSDIVLVACAGICNSIMDTVRDKWGQSKLTLFHPWTLIYKFFLSDGWKNKYFERDPIKGRWKVKIFGIWVPVPVQLTDSWHFFKAIMIVLFCVAICFKSWQDFKDLERYYSLAILGLAWNVPFNTFYNLILRTKEYRSGIWKKK